MPDFLSIHDILLIHSDQIERYGGEPGLRDLGLLESAVAQPQATFDGAFLHDGPYEMAAAYLFHIVNNHAFIDGNKRAGAVAAFIFLDINQIEIEATEEELYQLTIGVARSELDKKHVADFFRQHAK